MKNDQKPKLILLEAVLMPNDEIICLGHTIGWKAALEPAIHDVKYGKEKEEKD